MYLLVEKGPCLAHDIGLNDKNINVKEEDVDEVLLQKGISYFYRNFFSLFVCMLTGLLSLMYIPSISTVLHLTKNSGSPALSFRRYLSTLQHTLRWYQGHRSLQDSLVVVRAKHKHAAMLTSGITQYDMVLTQWAFIGPALLFPRKLGIPRAEDEDMRGLVYIMYLVGKYLGIKEDLNICSGGVQNAAEYSHLILNEIISKKYGTETSTEICKDMARHLLDGVNILNPFIDQGAFHCWTYRLLTNQELEERLTLEPKSKFLYNTMMLVLENLMHRPVLGSVIRYLANNLMRLNIFLANEWADYIVDKTNSSLPQSGLGWLEPFLAIPVFAIISGATVAWDFVKRDKFASVVLLSFFIFNLINILK